MKRALCFVLPLLLAGCGGRASNHPSDTVDPAPVAATLGSASLDLAIAGNTGIGDLPYGTSMTGTSSAQGSLKIVDTGPVQAGSLQVSATLFPTPSHGTALGQVLTLDLVHPATLAVGSKFDLGDGTSSASYTENASWTSEPIAGDGMSRSWSASGGTVEVTALAGATVTLKLTNVALGEPGPGTSTPLTLSGTMTGVVTLPLL